MIYYSPKNHTLDMIYFDSDTLKVGGNAIVTLRFSEPTVIAWRSPAKTFDFDTFITYMMQENKITSSMSRKY